MGWPTVWPAKRVALLVTSKRLDKQWQGRPGGSRGVHIQEAPIAEGPLLGGGHAGQSACNALLMAHHISIPLQPVHTLQQLCLLHIPLPHQSVLDCFTTAGCLTEVQVRYATNSYTASLPA